jgi:hypothetical protein
VLLLVLSLCGFSGALATRLLDPLITSIAATRPFREPSEQKAPCTLAERDAGSAVLS